MPKLASIKPVYTSNVIGAHLKSISEVKIRIGPSNNRWLPIPGEGVSAILHDRVEIIGSLQIVGKHFLKVALLSRDDVLGEDLHILVPVGADLLMVEAQSMKNLVLHRWLEQATVSLEGDSLSSALTAHVRITPFSREEVKEIDLVCPPDKANAGGLVEGEQGTDDDVALLGGIYRGDGDRYSDVASTFGPLAASGCAWISILG